MVEYKTEGLLVTVVCAMNLRAEEGLKLERRVKQIEKSRLREGKSVLAPYRRTKGLFGPVRDRASGPSSISESRLIFTLALMQPSRSLLMNSLDFASISLNWVAMFCNSESSLYHRASALCITK